MSVQHAWQGRVDEGSFRVRARIAGTQARLLYGRTEGLTDPATVGPVTATADAMVTLDATGLDPDTRYYWAIEVDGTVDSEVTGTCRTAPIPGVPASFTFAVSGDAGLNPEFPGVGAVDAPVRLSNSPAFDTIRQHSPAFFAHLGDLTYYDLGSGNHGLPAAASAAQYRSMYNDVLTQPHQHRLYREVPLVYVYDDHDYGPNDSDRTAPGRDNVTSVYRERVPHYDTGLPGATDPVGQTWTWGRVRFVMWDSRADRDVAVLPPTQLGAAQKAWLDGVVGSATEEFLVIFSPSPWLGLAGDTWAGFEQERQEIAAMVIGHGWAGRMVMISADKHVLALDSGANNDAGGWPTAVLAPVDANPGSLTDQYDVGMTAGRGQYGLVEVDDRGYVIEVRITGWIDSNRWRSHTVRVLTSTPFHTNFPQEQAPWRIEIAPSAEPGNPDTWVWEDITAFVRVGDDITIGYGRSDEFSTVSPTSCSLTLDNRDGRFSPNNPNSPYYGEIGLNTPLRVSWDGLFDRFTGYVSSWLPRWDQAGNDATVPVRADGILRRLSQGQKPLHSAIRRELTAPSRPKAIAYWPLEDGTDATLFPSAFGGQGRIMRVSEGEANPAAYDGFPGSGPTLQLGTGRLYGPVSAAEDTGDLILRTLVHVPDNGVPQHGALVVLHTTGSAARWVVLLNATGDLQLRCESESGAEILDTGFAGYAMNGRNVSLAVDLHTDGANINWSLLTFDMDDRSALLLKGTVANQTVGYATSVELNFHQVLEEVAVGHVAVTNDRGLFGETADVLSGYVGERAAERISRLCAEEGIAIGVRGDTADSIPMGPQRSETLLDLLREAEATDGGVLYEASGTLAYQTRIDRYNRAPTMELDVAAGHLAAAPEPADDDQQTRNDVEARRVDGSAVTVTDDEHVRRHGRYDSSVAVNTETDAILPDVAGWHVHLGTVDDMRWPMVALDLAATPEVIPAWLETRLGDRIRVAYSPPQLPATDIDVHVEGWEETLNLYTWRIELNCSPSTPWRIGEVGGSDATRIDTDGSALDGSATALDTDLVVGTTGPNDPRWVTGQLGTATLATPAGTSAASTQGADSLSVPLPEGWRAGQLAIAAFNVNDNAVTYLTHPGSTGWTPVDGSPRTTSSMHLGAWYKVLQAGDTDPGITLSGTQKIAGVIATYDGVDLNDSPVAVVGARGERGGATSEATTAPGITTTQDEQRIVGLFFEKSSTATILTADGGMVPRVVQFTEGGGQCSAAVVDQVVTNLATATGARTATYDASSGAGYGILLALSNAVDDEFVVDVAGEECTVHEITDALVDQYDRAESNGWGTSTSGHVWSVTGGNGATDFSVGASTGRVALDSIENRRFTWTSGRDWRDVDLYADITVPALAIGGAISAGLIARWTNIANFYMANLFHRPQGDIYLSIFKRTDHNFLTVADRLLPITYTAGVPTRVRFQCIGERLRAKLWHPGEHEPQAWTVDATDPTHGTGAIGTHTNLNSGNTNTQPIVVEYANLRLVNPQRFVVTRSVNGIIKQQATGNSVRLSHPTVMGI